MGLFLAAKRFAGIAVQNALTITQLQKLIVTQLKYQRRFFLAKQPNFGNPLELRRALPDTALHMETDLLMAEALELRLIAWKNRAKKVPRITIALSDGHIMHIQPVDRGANGYGEWMSFPNCDCGAAHSEYLLRVVVEIDDIYSPLYASREIFTIEANSLDNLVRKSLQTYYNLKHKFVYPEFLPNSNIEGTK